MNERLDPLAEPEGYGQRRHPVPAGRQFAPGRAKADKDDTRCDVVVGKTRCKEERRYIWSVGCMREHTCQVDLCAGHAIEVSAMPRGTCTQCGGEMLVIRKERADGVVISELSPADVARLVAEKQAAVQQAFGQIGIKQ